VYLAALPKIEAPALSPLRSANPAFELACRIIVMKSLLWIDEVCTEHL
jgi:hypothetical protein